MKLHYLTKQDYVEGDALALNIIATPSRWEDHWEGEATAPNIVAMLGPLKAFGRARLLPSLRCYGSAGASPSLVMNSLRKLVEKM